MPPPLTNSQAEETLRSLPLFRPEVMAAHGNLHGEILLIRPLSITFLIWLGVGLGVAVLGLLFFARIPESVPVTGVLLSIGTPKSGSQPEASLDVPPQLAPFLRVGTSMVVRCPGCTDLGKEATASVIRIENPGTQTIRVTIVLPSEIAQSLRSSDSAGSALVEAEILTGRASLMHWLLKPSSR